MKCIEPVAGVTEVSSGKSITFPLPDNLAAGFEVVCMTLNEFPAVVGRYVVDVFVTSLVNEDGIVDRVKDDIIEWRENGGRFF